MGKLTSELMMWPASFSLCPPQTKSTAFRLLGASPLASESALTSLLEASLGGGSRLFSGFWESSMMSLAEPCPHAGAVTVEAAVSDIVALHPGCAHRSCELERNRVRTQVFRCNVQF